MPNDIKMLYIFACKEMIYTHVLWIKSGSLMICEIVNYSLNSHPLSSMWPNKPFFWKIENQVEMFPMESKLEFSWYKNLMFIK
jgi:hypothetical protein